MTIAPRATLTIGTFVRDKWRVDAVLGAGGMATVYAATHRNGARVALKVLHPELALDPGTRERFRREGYLANQVEHPGVVRVLDDDVTEEGHVFLVMERLTGRTVKDHWLAARRRLPLIEALDIVARTLDVLASAHAQGIVHRDVKPDNLFLEDTNRLRLLDFGIARTREAGMATASGALLGTPAFMAPEQALARWDEVDARTDLFAVGATFWTLVTGTLVHRGHTQNELLVSGATRAVPSIATVIPDATTALIALVDRSLAFERDARWPSATDMRSAVDAAKASFRSDTVRIAPPDPALAEAATLYPAPRAPAPSAPPLPATATGTMVGRFELGERISPGDDVYRARDTTLEREVAVKLLTPGREGGQARADRERMLRDAQAAATLRHPNVVEVLEVGESAGEAYVALELVGGQSLAQLLPVAGQFSIAQRLRWLLELASALGAAHARGVVLGDVEPRNVFLSERGAIKVTGFRFAATGEDPRDDQRAWGCFAAHLLAGAPQLEPTAARAALARDGVPPPIIDAIARTLAPEPAARFASFAPLRRALEAHLVEIEPSRVETRARGRSAALSIALSLAALGVGAGLWRFVSAPPAATSPLTLETIGPAVRRASPRADATASASATAAPSASAVVTASAAASPATTGRWFKTGCLCFPNGGPAMCKTFERLRCTCRDKEGFQVYPRLGQGTSFTFPRNDDIDALDGKPCSGFHRIMTGSVESERPAEGAIDGCRADCASSENYAGSDGAFCRGVDVRGKAHDGKLKCYAPP